MDQKNFPIQLTWRNNEAIQLSCIQNLLPFTFSLARSLCSFLTPSLTWSHSFILNRPQIFQNSNLFIRLQTLSSRRLKTPRFRHRNTTIRYFRIFKQQFLCQRWDFITRRCTPLSFYVRSDWSGFLLCLDSKTLIINCKKAFSSLSSWHLNEATYLSISIRKMIVVAVKPSRHRKVDWKMSKILIKFVIRITIVVLVIVETCLSTFCIFCLQFRGGYRGKLVHVRQVGCYSVDFVDHLDKSAWLRFLIQRKVLQICRICFWILDMM